MYRLVHTIGYLAHYSNGGMYLNYYKCHKVIKRILQHFLSHANKLGTFAYCQYTYIVFNACTYVFIMY